VIKLIVLLGLLAIILCLGSGAYFLVKRGGKPQSMAWSLTWRIVLSFALFGFLFFAYWMGWIHPHAAIPVVSS
jgi:hypothetical protein